MTFSSSSNCWYCTCAKTLTYPNTQKPLMRASQYKLCCIRAGKKSTTHTTTPVQNVALLPWTSPRFHRPLSLRGSDDHHPLGLQTQNQSPFFPPAAGPIFTRHKQTPPLSNTSVVLWESECVWAAPPSPFRTILRDELLKMCYLFTLNCLVERSH